MRFFATVLLGFWVRTSVSLLIPVVFTGLLFLADSYLKENSRSRAIMTLEESGVEVLIEEAVDAAAAGRLFLLEQLQMAGIDLGRTGDSGQTPLIAALRCDAHLTADYLIQEFEVERTLHMRSGDTGATAFEEAVHAGRFSLAEKIHCSVNELNVTDHSSLKEIWNKKGEFADGCSFSYLLRLGISPDEVIMKWGENLPLILAVEREDVARIRRFIDSGADVRITGPDGNTLLVGAILKGQHDLVIELIKAGAVVNHEEESSNHPPGKITPVEAAIRSGDLFMVKLVLCHGVDPDPEISFAALQSGDDALLQLLFRNGVSPDLENSDGVRLLDQALISNSPEQVEMLIRAGADIANSLAFALHSGNPDLVDILLSNGADIDELGGEEGGALLDYAFRSDNMKLVGILLKHGANLDAVSRGGGILFASPTPPGKNDTQSVSLGIEKPPRKIAGDILR